MKKKFFISLYIIDILLDLCIIGKGFIGLFGTPEVKHYIFLFGGLLLLKLDGIDYSICKKKIK